MWLLEQAVDLDNSDSDPADDDDDEGDLVISSRNTALDLSCVLGEMVLQHLRAAAVGITIVDADSLTVTMGTSWGIVKG